MGVFQNKIDIENLKSSGGGGGGGSTHIYSTDPQKVGKWLDGSDVYKVTLESPNQNAGSKQFDLSSYDVKRILSARWLGHSGAVQFVTYDSNGENGRDINYNTNTKVLSAITNSYIVDYVIVEYLMNE